MFKNKFLRKFLVVTTLFSLLFSLNFLSACSESNDTTLLDTNSLTNLSPNTLISYEHIYTASEENIALANRLLEESGYETQLTHGIDLYQVTYRTTDLFGNNTQASGLVIIPQRPLVSLSIFSYQHGTLFDEDDAPSLIELNANSIQQNLPSIIAGGLGYISVSADYLGFGVNSGFHPYLERDSSAYAVIDLIRATRYLAKDLGLTLENKNYLAGYSEGGYVTLAAAKTIQENYSEEIQISAVAAGAGPYDLELTARELADNPLYDRPGYMASILFTYAQKYSEIELNRIFRAPYNNQIQEQLNRDKSLGELDALLPQRVESLFQGDFVSALESEVIVHPLETALQENQVFDWKPEFPVHFFHCDGDEIVPVNNSYRAIEAMEAQGAEEIFSTIVEGGSHADCTVIDDIVNWMESY